MKAAVTRGKGDLALADLPTPAVGEYDCLVKMEATVFCNTTDRHVVEGTFPAGGLEYPAILGHESVGRIVSIGAKVRHFATGERVLRAYAVYPRETLGGFASAWGGLAEYGKVRDWRAMVADGALAADKVPGCFRYQQRVPDELDDASALLLINVKELLSATNRLEPLAGRRLLIAGAGVAGCLIGMCARLKGAARVTVTARREAPLRFALAQGAADDVTLLSQGHSIRPDYDVLVDTTGSLDVLLALRHHVLPGGAIRSYAIYDGMSDPAIFDPLRERHSYERIDPAEAEAHDEACRLLLDGGLDVGPLLTTVLPAERFDDAWRAVLEKRCIKTAVRW